MDPALVTTVQARLAPAEFSGPWHRVEALLHTHIATFQVCLRYIVDRGCVMAVGTGDDPDSVEDYTKENLEIFSFQLTDDEVDALSAV